MGSKNWKTVFEAAMVGTSLLALSASCGEDNESDDGREDASVDPGCPAADAGCPAAAELPADPKDWKAWLDAEGYKSWHCDPAPQEPIEDSPHGQNIICVNDALWGARCGEGAFPVGSASLKLTFNAQGGVKGRYIDARLRDEAGAKGWYFYNEGGPQGYGTDPAAKFCADCHDNSGARDFLRRLPQL